MTTKDLVLSYYDSLNQKDSKWQELWAEASVFQDASKILNAQRKEAVIQSFTSFLKGVEAVTVNQMIVEGENVCAIASYVYVNPKGEKMRQDVSEVWIIKENKLVKLTIYFDLTAYRTFMKS